jgi:uncharacterized protein affecting Mg2+/Co2+ transport
MVTPIFTRNSIPRKYEADYLEKDSNPNKDKYVAAMQILFSTYGNHLP